MHNNGEHVSTTNRNFRAQIAKVFYYKYIMKLLLVIDINYCSKPTIHVYNLSLFIDNYFFKNHLLNAHSGRGSTIEQTTTYSFIVASGNDGRITAVEAGREDIGIVSLFQLNRRRHLSVIDTLPTVPDQHPPVVARRREGSLGVGESHRVHTAEVAEKSLAIETRAFQKTIGGYPTG